VRRRRAAAAIALAILAGAAAAEPFLPADDSVVVEILPLAGSPVVAQARELSRELELTPTDAQLAVETARAWLAIGRAEGDPRYVGRAQAALSPWSAGLEPPTGVLQARSAVLRAQHEFPAALTLLDRVVVLEPDNVQAQLDRATVLENLGDPRGARQACVEVGYRYPGLLADACLASAESLSSGAATAYTTLAAALARDPDEKPGVRSWALTVLGDIAALRGQHAQAERHYRDAAALDGLDLYLRMALADLLLHMGRAVEVLELTEGLEQQDGFLLRRALAMQVVRPAEAEPLRLEFARRVVAMRQRGDESHLRDAARFTLLLEGQPREALAMAKRNWDRQRAAGDAGILLEAALAAGDPSAARPVLDWIAQTGIEDVTLIALAQRLSSAP
jgi:Flp pilus assembly protein TadD